MNCRHFPVSSLSEDGLPSDELLKISCKSIRLRQWLDSRLRRLAVEQRIQDARALRGEFLIDWSLISRLKTSWFLLCSLFMRRFHDQWQMIHSDWSVFGAGFAIQDIFTFYWFRLKGKASLKCLLSRADRFSRMIVMTWSVEEEWLKVGWVNSKSNIQCHLWLLKLFKQQSLRQVHAFQALLQSDL